MSHTPRCPQQSVEVVNNINLETECYRMVVPGNVLIGVVIVEVWRKGNGTWDETEKDRGNDKKKKSLGASFIPQITQQKNLGILFSFLGRLLLNNYWIILRRVPRKEFLDITDRVPWAKKSVVTCSQFVCGECYQQTCKRWSTCASQSIWYVFFYLTKLKSYISIAYKKIRIRRRFYHFYLFSREITGVKELGGERALQSRASSII